MPRTGVSGNRCIAILAPNGGDIFLAVEQSLARVEATQRRGFRASIYNAMPEAGVAALREYMLDFAKKNAK